MLTHFYLIFQVEISGNAFLANLGPFILKLFRGSMPLDTPGTKNLATAPANCIKGFPNIKKADENLDIAERFPGEAESPQVR